MFRNKKKTATNPTLSKIADNLRPFNEIVATGATVSTFLYYTILIGQALKQPDYIQKNLNDAQKNLNDASEKK